MSLPTDGTTGLVTFEATCVTLEYDPHERSHSVRLSMHTPDDLADVNHERHHRPAAVVEINHVSADELRFYRIGARYLVSIGDAPK